MLISRRNKSSSPNLGVSNSVMIDNNWEFSRLPEELLNLVLEMLVHLSLLHSKQMPCSSIELCKTHFSFAQCFQGKSVVQMGLWQNMCHILMTWRCGKVEKGHGEESFI